MDDQQRVQRRQEMRKRRTRRHVSNASTRPG
jgi:hypothetical protein